jgi:hypothetical protein
MLPIRPICNFITSLSKILEDKIKSNIMQIKQLNRMSNHLYLISKIARKNLLRNKLLINNLEFYTLSILT